MDFYTLTDQSQHVQHLRVSRLTFTSRGQHERPTQRHYRYCTGWSSKPLRSSLHSGESCQIFYCSGYAKVRRTDSPFDRMNKTGCIGYCMLTILLNRNAPMFRSRTSKGRGVGAARGRATVNRARGQRGGRGA